MALAQLVYPGAVHSRLLHSLGAYHLMCNAVSELRDKGVDITEDEAVYSAFKAFVTDVKATNLTDLLAAVKKLVATSAQFGKTAKAALAQLEADFK